MYNDSDFVSGGSGPLTVIDPAITVQPANTTVECTSSAVLSVTAVGTGTLTYQWYTPDANGIAVPGATSSSLTVSNANGSSSYAVVVTGSAGTATSSVATVSTVDTTGPVVTLNPGANTVVTGHAYTDPGATAFDACAGSLSVSTNGTVNTNVAGSYTLTYSATDPSSNPGSAIRVVSVFDGAAITTGPTPPSSTNAQGATFTLGVTATGSAPLSYQWYTVEAVVGSNAVVAGATSASPTNLIAQPVLTPGVNDKFATNHYFVIVSGPANSVTSSVARVVIILDKVLPTAPTVSSPAKNKATPLVQLVGAAKDAKGGDVAHVYYKYVNQNPASAPSLVDGPINEAVLGGVSVISRTFTGSAQPLLPGTNNLEVWSVDLAGNISLTNTVQFFYEVPLSFTLNKLGDGSGTVAWKGVWKDKGLVQYGTNAQPQQILLNVGETYALTYAPDKKTGVSTGVTTSGTNIVVSVVTNTAGMGPGTNSTKKFVASLLVQSNLTSQTLEFDRDRFVDMAGTYLGVFTASTSNPTKESSRYLSLTVTKTGVASGYLLTADGHTKDSFSHVQFSADGNTNFTTPGNITITGTLVWAGSEDTNGVKQFVGSATDGVWTAPILADRADKTAIANGAATMQIPPVNGTPAGTGLATVLAKSGSIKSIYTLADDDKDPATWSVIGNKAGRLPQWIATKSGGLLFGTLNVTSNMSSIVGTNLSWIHPPAGNLKYPNMLLAGFTNSPFDAVCSPYTPASVTGAFTLDISGGNVISNVNQVVNFAPGTVANTSVLTASGAVTAGKVDATGKVTITFLDGGAKKHKSIATGIVLQNATNTGAGFFIYAPTPTTPTNSGTMSLTPQ